MNTNLPKAEQGIVLEILAKTFDLLPEKIAGDARIKEDLGADSLTVIEITMVLEERFHATIADERLEEVKTVEELCEALAEALFPDAQPR
ncbi:MAG: phosphopantetheine-binding protein [Verrucomicrobiota bacterium]